MPVPAPTSLTRDDLTQWFQNGCKPPENWLIGTEHELFVFDPETRLPIPYQGKKSISALFDAMAAFGWEPVCENGNIIAMNRDGASLSLEPAGQFELSGAPLKTLHETAQELDKHFSELKKAGADIGLGFLTMGLHPTWQQDDMPHMPKARYDVIRPQMKEVGTRGIEIMYRTCTTQVNLDYSSESDMARKMRAGMVLQPFAIALFATSPYFNGEKTGYISTRSQFWTELDKARTGFLPMVLDDDFGFDDYTRFARDVPMFIAMNAGETLSAADMSFNDFIRGELPALPGQKATLKDWEVHLGTIFPEVRLKKFLEMRGADCGPPEMIKALPAFWVGLLYDENTLEKALDLIRNWHKDDILNLYQQARRDGLKGAGIKGTPFRELSDQVLGLSVAGLKARGLGEEVYLEPLQKVLRTGQTCADSIIKKVEASPGNNPDCLFEFYRL